MPAGEDSNRENLREYARLRGLMLSPGVVELLHSQKNRIWLCDKYVLVDVTASTAITGLDDGVYRLQANKGLILKGDYVNMINLPVYFDQVRRTDWLPVRPTIWSLTDSKAKAMLLYAEIASGDLIPLAVNQDVWRAFLASYPDARLYHSGDGGPFLIATISTPEQAYIQPIAIPQDAQAQACAIIYATERERRSERDKHQNIHRA